MFTQGRTFNSTTKTSIASSGFANGVDTTATGTGSSAGVAGVNGAANGASAYGSQALAQDANTTAIGFRATAKQEGSVAVGYQAQALADPSTALGASSLVTANADNGVALGASSAVSGANSVAVGFNAQATASNAVALGTNSVANQANTVSVGSQGNERRITNVASGVAPTDAANVGQLNSVSNRVGEVARVAYSGTALSLAMSGAYQRTPTAGKTVLGLGLGNYKSYSAIALTYKQTNEVGNITWGAGVATTGKDTGVNIGIGWEF